MTYSYHYASDIGGMSGPLGAVFAVLGGLIMVAILLGIVAYLLASIGVSRLARGRGMSGSWMAWIPLLGLYLLGAIVDDIRSRSGRPGSNYRTLLLVLSVVATAGGLIPLVGGIAAALCGFALYILQAVAVYQIYQDYAPGSAVPMLVFSILLPLSCIFLFAIRNRRPLSLAAAPAGGYRV